MQQTEPFPASCDRHESMTGAPCSSAHGDLSPAAGPHNRHMLLVIATDDVRHLTAESVGRDAVFDTPIHTDANIAI